MYLQLEEFMQLGIQPWGNELQLTIKLAEEVNKFYPAYVEINVDTSCTTKTFQYAQVCLKHDTLRISIGKDWRNKRFNVIWDRAGLYSHISTYTYESESKRIERPGNFGILNTKKILAWINYYEVLSVELRQIENQMTAKEGKFLQSLEELPVTWSLDRKSGTILSGGLVYSFCIKDSSIAQKIEIHYNIEHNLAVFQAMADNKYKAAQ